MAIYKTTDGRTVTSTRNADGTKTKNIVNQDGSKTTELYNPKTRLTTPLSTTPLPPAVSNPIESPTPATQIAPAPTLALPEPTAVETAATNLTSVQGAVDTAKNSLNTLIGTQKTEVESEIAKLEKEQERYLKEAKPLTQPFREKLEAKERERLYINKNFEANQKLTDELSGLLTEGNELINIAMGRQVSGKVLDKSLSRTIADVNARAGVIEAVMSARNGQIAQAERSIDRTVAAIVADRTDEINYYNTLLSMNDKKLVTLTGEKYKLAETLRNQAVKEVENAEKTATYIKELMINPETASFMADAGVSLSDSVDGIKAKMAKQSKIQEAIDMRNNLVDAGYDISPVPVPGGIAIEAGGQTLYAKVRPGSELDLRIKAQEANIAQSYAAAAASRASAAATETGRLLDLAAAGDPAAISKLGLTMDDGSKPSLDLMAFAGEYAASGKLPTSSTLPKGISVGSIAELARTLPKPTGTIVNANTAVADTRVGAAESQDITALYNITQSIAKLKKLDEERQDGLLGGTLGKIFGSNDQAAYLTQRKAIVDEIARMQTGAALTLDEQEFYNDYLPGRFSDTFFLGQNPEDKIANFETVMNDKLRNALKSNQLSIYGYSEIEAGGEKYRVGEIITNEYGQSGMVQPDGSIVLMDI